jgi:hypothetical protein
LLEDGERTGMTRRPHLSVTAAVAARMRAALGRLGRGQGRLGCGRSECARRLALGQKLHRPAELRGLAAAAGEK